MLWSNWGSWSILVSSTSAFTTYFSISICITGSFSNFLKKKPLLHKKICFLKQTLLVLPNFIENVGSNFVHKKTFLLIQKVNAMFSIKVSIMLKGTKLIWLGFISKIFWCGILTATCSPACHLNKYFSQYSFKRLLIGVSHHSWGFIQTFYLLALSCLPAVYCQSVILNQKRKL